jgi:hypothetical protein
LVALGSGAFSAGSRSVFYSGEGALAAARAGRGTSLLLENTVGGRALNSVDMILKNLIGRGVPQWVWKATSANFAANAKGVAQVFLRNPSARSVWTTIERPILRWRQISTVFK